MSTKTSIKRIAAVAAVALTLGGFSAVSAHAAAAPSVAITGGTAVGTSSTAAPVVGTYAAVTLTTGSADKLYTITSTGVGSIAVPSLAASAVNAPLASLATTGVTSTSATVFGSTTASDVPGSAANHVFVGTETLALSAYSATAGTQVITIKGDSSTAITATLTWGAAPALVAQYATTQIVAGANSINGAGTLVVTGNRYTGASDAVVASATFDNVTPSAVVGVALASAYDTLISGYLTATITGAGAVSITGDVAPAIGAPALAPQGASVTTAAKSPAFRVNVFADGRPGVGTLVISSGTTTIATKTITFVGAATKVVATQVLKVAKAGSQLGVVNGAATTVANSPAFTLTVTDANGNAAALPTNYKAKSSDPTVITVDASTCAQETGVPGTYDCFVNGAGGALSGSSATVTFSLAATSTEVADATTGLYSIKSEPVTFAIGGSVSTVALTTDASDYAPLAPIKLIATAKDSKGNAAYDVDAAILASLKSSSALAGGTLTSPTMLVGGVATLTGIYAPSLEGTVTITGVENVSGAATAATPATFTVSNGAVLSSSQAAIDAAQEATDAANAAYDAANNAMDSADAATAAAQDASDNASAALAAVTSLSATVAKLVKSVAALATALTSIKKKLGVK